jgi:metal-sulfur cluster biosynthetic enzyme
MLGPLHRRSIGAITAVVDALNEITDPCSLGQAEPIGLVDLGLLIGVAATSRPEGSLDVTLTLRTTTPGCFYVPYFNRAIEHRVMQVAGVGGVHVTWEPSLDWTDDAMAPAVRQRLAERRAAVRDRQRVDRSSSVVGQ